ncbi:hypothetical protein ABZS83_23265 [Streptomyces sp. NPDC005426]|uniref:hypothetical protein n=1 Tax=Streptomyces sp. NPDC005426 TaxID=3155344 RepID=UPI0033BCB952
MGTSTEDVGEWGAVVGEGEPGCLDPACRPAPAQELPRALGAGCPGSRAKSHGSPPGDGGRGVPFRFASPTVPDDGPRWWDGRR